MLEKLTIVKVGGNLIDDTEALNEFLSAFSQINGKKLLVHGGGKLATRLSSQLGINTEMVNGRRVTDADNLKIVTMVYAGYVNKNIVAALQAKGVKAIGIAGCDFDIMRAQKRKHPTIDFGFVGDIIKVDENALSELIEQEGVPVIAPITHDGNGQLLNTNADSIVTDVAIALSKIYEVKLIYSFEKAGVLKSIDNEDDVVDELNKESIEKMQEAGAINTGMMPKTDNALKASTNGVGEVIIGNLVAIQQGFSYGTKII
jgi:acetylglutamate kinase